ncbi:uncharacterized protein [Medicago truncatula]|uniref:uncharacterized protein isoform X2 n=1 Tax=Medicago truncatula TaxID=3880 RepID=UPI000D2F3A58|nr:uncharacterized protein LOC11405697 isoform X2 [Medicago truncatula]
MASSWFLKLTFKCLYHFAWPLVALVYPMCASVQAIETDSYAETKDLISYWILLSLIYLFEYAFMNLLLWFQLWPYTKLMIIFWLIIPDFGRASYVYNKLSRFLKPHIVTWGLNNSWKKWFFEKDNFLMHAEIYMKENGTEALEKLIASKNTMCRPDAEATNEISATDDKEMLKTNGERLQTEQKDIQGLEAIEKKEIPATKQDIPVMLKIRPSQNASSVTVETKGTAESERAGGEVPRSSTQKEVQREWTCAICLVTTSREKDLISHLNGRKHRDTSEALISKKQPTRQKQKGAEATTNKTIATDNKKIPKDNPVMPKIASSQNASSATVETKGTAKSDKAGEEYLKSSTQKELQEEWPCALCSVTTSSKITLNSHLNGRKHRASCEAALKAKKQAALQKLNIYQSKEEVKQKDVSNKFNSNVKSGDNILKKGLKGTVVMDDKVQKNQAEPVRTHNSKSICRVCDVVLLSEANVVSHMNGKKHLAKFKDIGIA